MILKSNNHKLPVISLEEKRHYQLDQRSLEGMLKIEGKNHSKEYE
jgi:hypothetical protein